jgi:SET domain-containing protein
MTPLLSEVDDRFEVRESTVPGAGRGVFARVALVAGDVLEVIGVRVPRESVSDRCTHFADHHKFRVGDALLIPVGFGGLVNHSTTPNLEKLVEGERVFFRTLRPIAPDEELFFRYPDVALERFGIVGAT